MVLALLSLVFDVIVFVLLFGVIDSIDQLAERISSLETEIILPKRNKWS